MSQNKNVFPSAIDEELLRQPTDLREILDEKHALDFQPYKSGLFPASALPAEIGEMTGMGLAWLRDNCHVANGLWESGDTESAAAVGRAILDVFNASRFKIDGVASGRLDPTDPQYRLPVRVEGDTLAPDTRPQIQNDSIGYSLWLVSRLIGERVLKPTTDDIETIAKTTRYLQEIEYWEDLDSGHWEEERKVNASSIGAVIAGLRATGEMFESLGINHSPLNLSGIIKRGRDSLDQILPYETREPDNLRRRYDAALLFLVEPLNVLSPEQADMVVNDITQNLVREKGVIRYPKDTYWGPNFRDQFKLDERATYAPGRLEQRNQRADQIADDKLEAQWTIFDPILSVYWGKRFMATGSNQDRLRQLHHLDRSLSQLAPAGKDMQALKFPEAYFWQNGDWVPNDHVPLLWSQANLLLALDTFEKSSQTAA